MSDPYFFGYGSLVNRLTHDYAPAGRASLGGWARGWVTMPGRPVANLTAVPDEGARIEGLIAPVPGSDWTGLDRRERGYDRRPADDVRHQMVGADDIAVYAIPPQPSVSPAPILLSYLDVVVQGYLREFGQDGVGRFFETTVNWDHPIADDRNEPLYPRAQVLTGAETALVDGWVASLGLEVRPPDTGPGGWIAAVRRRLAS